MKAAGILLDNPILVKHVRSRLRQVHLVPGIAAVVVIAGCIAAAPRLGGMFGATTALAILLVLQLIVLEFMGGYQVGMAVANARISGILEFHRVTPLPPSWVAFGFLVGAPIREYLLFACTLPFVALCAAEQPGGLVSMVQCEVPLILSAWVIHAVTLLSSLVTREPKAATTGVAGLAVLGIFVAAPLIALLNYATGYAQEFRTLGVFGVPVPWILFFPLYELPAVGFLFVACARKMRGERVHAYTKAQAVACLATIAVLLVGALWEARRVDYLVVGVVYGLVALGMVLAATITPGAAEYLKGVRRALDVGRRRPSPWDDAGSNRLGVVLLCAIVLAAATVAWEFIEGRPADRPPAYSQTIAIGVFVVAYFGLGLQWFSLRWGRRGESYFRLFLFLNWALPPLAGLLLASSRFAPRIFQSVMALSPLPGIAMSTRLGGLADSDAPRFAALAPAVTFAFVFNFLLIVAQRRIDLEMRSVTKGAAA